MKKRKLIKKINELKTSRIDMRDTYISQGNYGVAATVNGYINGLNAVLDLLREESEPLYDWNRIPSWVQWIWMNDNQNYYLVSDESPLWIGRDCHMPRMGAKVHILSGDPSVNPIKDWRNSLEQRPSKES